jgi:hypothetical protein
VHRLRAEARPSQSAALVESIGEKRSDMISRLTRGGLADVKQEIRPLRRKNGEIFDFHDRVVAIEATVDAISTLHVYDLSGGADRLMDRSCGTIINHTWQ